MIKLNNITLEVSSLFNRRHSSTLVDHTWFCRSLLVGDVANIYQTDQDQNGYSKRFCSITKSIGVDSVLGDACL